jgi:hypothetical protein
MRSNAVNYALGIGLLALVGLAAPACGDDDGGGDTPGGHAGTAGSGAGAAGAAGAAGGSAGSAGSSGGSGGTGGSTGGTGGTGAPTVECGGGTCEGIMVPVLNIPIPPCCPNGESDPACGLDTSLLSQVGVAFDPPCQAKNQPGDLDTACPDSPPIENPSIPIPIPPFKGCCRAETSTCGYMVNDIAGFLNLEMGCVDSTPFLEGGTAGPCGGGGSGGAGGSGGSGGSAGGAGGSGGSAGGAGGSGGGTSDASTD